VSAGAAVHGCIPGGPCWLCARGFDVRAECWTANGRPMHLACAEKARVEPFAYATWFDAPNHPFGPVVKVRRRPE
jgi:hypothetical protein